MRTVGLALLLTLLGSGCPAPTSTAPPTPAPPAPTAEPAPLPWRNPALPGPHQVGLRREEVDDPLRPGEELELVVLYPALTEPDETPFTPFTRAIEDAPADPDGPYPVAIFSHGSGGINVQSLFFTDHLVSHGWVVLSINHPLDWIGDYQPRRRVEAVIQRVQHVSWLLDVADEMGADPRDDLFGLIDERDPIIAGHSLGALTTVLAAGWEIRDPIPSYVEDLAELGLSAPLDYGDPRFAAGIAMTPCGPSRLGEAGLETIDIPLLHFAGELDTICPPGEVEQIWSGTSGRSWIVDVEQAGHYTFSNMCDVLGGIFDDCEPPYREPAPVQELTNTLALDFLGVVLDGHPGYGAALADPGVPWAQVRAR